MSAFLLLLRLLRPRNFLRILHSAKASPVCLILLLLLHGNAQPALFGVLYAAFRNLQKIAHHFVFLLPAILHPDLWHRSRRARPSVCTSYVFASCQCQTLAVLRCPHYSFRRRAYDDYLKRPANAGLLRHPWIYLPPSWKGLHLFVCSPVWRLPTPAILRSSLHGSFC